MTQRQGQGTAGASAAGANEPWLGGVSLPDSYAYQTAATLPDSQARGVSANAPWLRNSLYMSAPEAARSEDLSSVPGNPVPGGAGTYAPPGAPRGGGSKNNEQSQEPGRLKRSKAVRESPLLKQDGQKRRGRR
ncbi:hypothetical protein MMF93_11825 [Streptomyces tubbatahanensis]|uniref:Uncharacterized protein n=1 Tax=Streptomyces tubbatahanensis TaxID=2923272 RepID=A0ABY3XRS8_9ACTN|nr:hypothetical protein [Streptomyces tubbatahanensis]UNS97122.1 hypothetical protein MMF93_11825 [Streptomyces tubbatahanensis]